MDFNSDVFVFSEKELDFTNEDIRSFIEKHVEKTVSDSGRRQGEFFEESNFKLRLIDYINGAIDFVSFSTGIARKLHEMIANSELPVSTDLLITDILIDSDKYIGILIFENKTAYTHRVVNDEYGVHSEIAKHYAILPNSTQKVDAYALINLNDFEVSFADKKRMIQGNETYVLPETILQCTQVISAKEAVKLVNKIATKVADEYGASTTKTISKAKKYLAETAETEVLSPWDMGNCVFDESDLMRQDFESKIKQAGIPEDIRIDKEYAVKTSRNHKIKTDTGIEITFPSDYFDNPKYIEFINNDDGTLSIELKNIGKITDR